MSYSSLKKRLATLEEENNQQTQTEAFREAQAEVAKIMDEYIEKYNSPAAKARREQKRKLYDEFLSMHRNEKGLPGTAAENDFWNQWHEYLVSVGYWTAEYLKAWKETENFYEMELCGKLLHPGYAAVYHDNIDTTMEYLEECKEWSD